MANVSLVMDSNRVGESSFRYPAGSTFDLLSQGTVGGPILSHNQIFVNTGREDREDKLSTPECFLFYPHS